MLFLSSLSFVFLCLVMRWPIRWSLNAAADYISVILVKVEDAVGTLPTSLLHSPDLHTLKGS